MLSVSLRHVSEQTLLSFSGRVYRQPCSGHTSFYRLQLLLCSRGFKSILPPSLGQARFTGMSQHQYHCPASPMPAAPALLPLGQPQSGYSIPCGSGILPSESASQPIRSSALPAGSATPYTTTTGYILFLFSLMKYILFLFANPLKENPLRTLNGLICSCLGFTPKL